MTLAVDNVELGIALMAILPTIEYFLHGYTGFSGLTWGTHKTEGAITGTERDHKEIQKVTPILTTRSPTMTRLNSLTSLVQSGPSSLDLIANSA
ncbi:hypothetical protein K432DRAFT_382067 [Lepidopterella palustris CBS 459.81]|uniref:Uncharacterized protein n=1 Tax=Lepidopterella palustris CBS 459.81 TaxID=1314670 RepID=A0A8E2JFG7_9PEZI|nr:hypothetical protein K432DRAFT_382067 [Lepidopterella palustris CBS 459.81]